MTPLADDRTLAPLRRGACPGVVDAMESADGWLMRIRLPGGDVTPAQLEVLAEVAARFGSRVIEVTSRANVQIRGIAKHALDAAADALVAAGMAHRDPSIDARRSVVLCPLAGHDPTEVVDCGPYGRAIVEALMDADLGGALPPKFGIVVDGGGDVGVRGVSADVAIGAALTPTGTPCWTIVLGGTLRCGGHAAARSTMDTTTAGRIAVAVAQTCASTGSRAHDLPADVIAGLLATMGAPSLRRPLEPPAATATVGVFEHTEIGRCNIIAAPGLARFDASVLSEIAALARSATAIRFTPTGGVALIGVQRCDAEPMCQWLRTLGWSIDPTDAAHTVTACIGSPGCAASRANTLTAAADIIDRRRRSGGVHGRVHLVGCEKACGASIDSSTIIADGIGAFHVDRAGEGDRL